MKRRGLTPTTRTYQTMLSGLARIRRWSEHPQQLLNAHSLYQYCSRHLHSLKEAEPGHDGVDPTPIAHYIQILGDAGLYQKVFDVFYELDKEGPLAPNAMIFTAMFKVIAQRVNPPDDLAPDMTIGHKNASDGRLLWRYLSQAMERNRDFKMDAHLLDSVLRAFSKGTSADSEFALDLARRYVGLAKPKETFPSPSIPLTAPVLEVILQICNYSGQHELCIYFVKQSRTLAVQAAQRVGKPASSVAHNVDRLHMEEVIKAYGTLAQTDPDASVHALVSLKFMLREEALGHNGPAIRPSANSFNLVLAVCSKTGDWTSAEQTFELMTGYEVVDFGKRAVSSDQPPVYKVAVRSRGRNLYPDAETMASLLHTALKAKNSKAVGQCMRMLHHFGAERLLNVKPSKMTGKDIPTAVSSQEQLANDILKAMDLLGKDASGSSADWKHWNTAKNLAQQRLWGTPTASQSSQKLKTKTKGQENSAEPAVAGPPDLDEIFDADAAWEASGLAESVRREQKLKNAQVAEAKGRRISTSRRRMLARNA